MSKYEYKLIPIDVHTPGTEWCKGHYEWRPKSKALRMYYDPEKRVIFETFISREDAEKLGWKIEEAKNE